MNMIWFSKISWTPIFVTITTHMEIRTHMATTTRDGISTAGQTRPKIHLTMTTTTMDTAGNHTKMFIWQILTLITPKTRRSPQKFYTPFLRKNSVIPYSSAYYDNYDSKPFQTSSYSNSRPVFRHISNIKQFFTRFSIIEENEVEKLL